MSEIVPLNARSLSFKRDGKLCTVEFNDEYLTCSFQHFPELHITKTPLWRIMPELINDRSISASARRFGQIASCSLLGGIVVFFSDIRTHVPLLAPALGLCAVYSLRMVFQSIFPLGKTKIVSEWGDELALIPQHEGNAVQRKAFEEALLESIREARQKHNEE